jgi:hypothetical protein
VRKSLTPELETKRVQQPGRETGSGPNGAFQLQGPTGAVLRITASDGTDPTSATFGFERVSVSVSHRDPTRREMCYIKNLFWPGDEVVYQLFIPESDFHNSADHTLHMWRHVSLDVPVPPAIGFRDNGPCTDRSGAYVGAAMRGLID